MGDFEDLLHNYTTHAGQHLPPIVDEAIAALGLTDMAQKEIIGDACAGSYLMGAEAAQAEILAQAIEQGVDLKVTQLNSLRDRPAD